MGTWSVSLTDLVARAGARIDDVVRKTEIDLFSRVIARSPVDTGRFRGNWQVSNDAPLERQTDALDPDGSIATDAAIDAVMHLPVGHVTHISNALPYAQRLEYGYSAQAPAGMVRLTAREFDAALQKAAA